MADVYVVGKSGEKYLFQSKYIKIDDSDCWPINVFLFANLQKTKDKYPDEKEWLFSNKDNAEYKLCLISNPDADKDFIMEDLKEDGAYKINIHLIKT